MLSVGGHRGGGGETAHIATEGQADVVGIGVVKRRHAAQELHGHADPAGTRGHQAVHLALHEAG